MAVLDDVTSYKLQFPESPTVMTELMTNAVTDSTPLHAAALSMSNLESHNCPTPMQLPLRCLSILQVYNPAVIRLALLGVYQGLSQIA